jgi:hypothetical protein
MYPNTAGPFTTVAIKRQEREKPGWHKFAFMKVIILCGTNTNYDYLQLNNELSVYILYYMLNLLTYVLQASLVKLLAVHLVKCHTFYRT